jgi:hypothetical protein
MAKLNTRDEDAEALAALKVLLCPVSQAPCYFPRVCPLNHKIILSKSSLEGAA